MYHNIVREYHEYSIPSDELWYHEVHEWAGTLGDIKMVAGVIAALSPNLSWDRNKILAQQAVDTGLVSGALPLSCQRANEIMAGNDPLDVLGGNKTRSFYSNIAFPYGDKDVTIDRHSLAIALGRKVTDSEQKKLSSKNFYSTVISAYHDAAEELGILPSELQATTWCSWRRRFKGKSVGDNISS
jgi:hypothetical protein